MLLFTEINMKIPRYMVSMQRVTAVYNILAKKMHDKESLNGCFLRIIDFKVEENHWELYLYLKHYDCEYNASALESKIKRMIYGRQER